MTTGVAAQRRVRDVADAAVRAGSRARATLGFALPATIAYFVLRPGDAAYPAVVVYPWVVVIAFAVGVHTLIHGYHYDHREGRRSAWALVLLAYGWGFFVVWLAVAATGGRGAGKREL